MQVLLNSEKLDIQLEDENSLGEILRGISDWLEFGPDTPPELAAHHLQAFVLDGKRFEVAEEPNENWGHFSQKPNEIGKLELFSEVRQASLRADEDVLLESLYALRNYFDMAQQALDAKRFSFLKKLFLEADSLLELFERSIAEAERRLAGENQLNHFVEAGENLLTGELRANLELWSDFRQCPENLEQREEATERTKAVFQDAFLLLDELYKDCAAKTSANNDTTQIAANLEQTGKELAVALGQLQRGGGVKQSLDCVAQLSRLLEQLLQKEIACEPLAQRFIEMKPFLEQLGSAIEEMDMVSVSDLAEYEIIPLIGQMVQLLKRE